MSRAFFVVSLLASLLAARELLAQNVRTVDPLLTITVAQGGGAAADGRGAVVSCVALSPDGRSLAAVGDDHMVRTFALADGQRQQEMSGHQRWVRGAAFTGDGQSLITADEDRKIIFWDHQTARQLRDINAGIQVYGMAASPAGDQFAVVGFGDQVKVFAANGQERHSLTAPGRHSLAVAFSADGQSLATGARNGKLSLWRLGQPAAIIDAIAADRRPLYAVAFSPDGRWLATGGDSDFIQVWDAQNGKKRLSIRRNGKTRSLIFCGPDLLAAGGTDNKVRIWDLARVERAPAANDAHIEDMQLVGHQGSVTSLAFDTRGGTIISGSYDTTVRVWSVKGLVPGLPGGPGAGVPATTVQGPVSTPTIGLPPAPNFGLPPAPGTLPTPTPGSFPPPPRTTNNGEGTIRE